jgi:hypothetical protein
MSEDQFGKERCRIGHRHKAQQLSYQYVVHGGRSRPVAESTQPIFGLPRPAMPRRADVGVSWGWSSLGENRAKQTVGVTMAAYARSSSRVEAAGREYSVPLETSRSPRSSEAPAAGHKQKPRDAADDAKRDDDCVAVPMGPPDGLGPYPRIASRRCAYPDVLMLWPNAGDVAIK